MMGNLAHRLGLNMAWARVQDRWTFYWSPVSSRRYARLNLRVAMLRRLVLLPGLLVLCSTSAWAEKSDAEYCAELTGLANKFVSGGGGDGRSFPDLFTQEAITNCQKGNYAKGIPVLEKRLRDSRVTLPSR